MDKMRNDKQDGGLKVQIFIFLLFIFSYLVDLVGNIIETRGKDAHPSIDRLRPDQPQACRGGREECGPGPARRLLRSLIGEKAYKDYIRRGWITVRGRSGLYYRIGPQGIKVYAPAANGEGHKAFEHLCLVFKDHGPPPTDSVIMRKIMVETDKFELRKKSNITRLCDLSQVRLDAIGLMLAEEYERKKRGIGV